MTIPSYDKFIEPTLRFLSEHNEPVRAAEVHDRVAGRMGLTDDQMAERLNSGEKIYKNRCGWAQDRLKRAGLSGSPRFGHWQLTQAGCDFAAQHPAPIDENVIRGIAKVSADSSANPLVDDGGVDTTILSVPEASPDELIETAIREIRLSVARDLQEYVGRVSPDDFEILVLDVLHAMGYGTSRESLTKVGGSGDEGIDGVISLDRLGLEKVYVQAKRWKNQVGSPEVQTFMGALQLRGATKGVLISSGQITGPAFEIAKKANGSVVLIDGARLAELMIDYEVGVNNKKIKVPSVDADYFETD